MNTLFADKPEILEEVPAYLFRETVKGSEVNTAETIKSLIHYKNQIAYIVSHKGKFSCRHEHHVVIITLAAIKDLHWALQEKFGESFDAPAGSVLIIPQGTEYT